MRRVLQAAFATAAIACLSAHAQAPVITLGDARIVAPAPANLVRLANDTTPYYRFLDGIQANSNNRLLAIYLPAADAKAADSGAIPEPKSWALAFIHKSIAGRAVTLAEFRKEVVPILEASLTKALTDSTARGKIDDGLRKGLEGLSGEFDIGSLKTGAVQPLGVYDQAPKYLTYGAVMKIQVTTPGGVASELPVVMVISMIHAGNRVMSLAGYRSLDSRSDIERTRADVKAWSEAFTKANP